MKNFSPSGPTITVNATTTSQVVQLPAHTGSDILVTNDGDTKVFLKSGTDANLVVDDTGMWITANSQQVLAIPRSHTHVALCTASGISTVGLQLGEGS